MNIKYILTLLGGIAIGAAAGVLGGKKYFENKYQKRYEDDVERLEQYYKMSDEYRRIPHDEESSVQKKLTTEERAEVKKEVKEQLTDQHNVNYSAMYQNLKDLAESEHPRDDEDENYVDEMAMFEQHQQDLSEHKEPRIISEEAWSDLPANIDKAVLYYYMYDETLCDENDQPIEDPERLIGDALDRYGFCDSDEKVIFVMNYELSTCYEIQKFETSSYY